MLGSVLHVLNESAFSTWLRESDWSFSLVESLHVLSIAAMAGTIAIVDLRLLGVLFRQQSVSRLTSQVTPVTWVGFALMAVSGTLLFVAQPEQNAVNPAFRLKVVLLILAGLNVFAFHRVVYRRIAAWDDQPTPPVAARVCGLVSLSLWTTIIILGRLIAYFPQTTP